MLLHRDVLVTEHGQSGLHNAFLVSLDVTTQAQVSIKYLLYNWLCGMSYGYYINA